MDFKLKTSAWEFFHLIEAWWIGSFGDKFKEPIGSTIVSSKRRRPIKGNQNVSCLVDGCSAELSSCREYHRRHRVCECHSNAFHTPFPFFLSKSLSKFSNQTQRKTPVVVVRSKELRFSQQCSRFQSPQEFDEEKRSCRKRLDGHNRWCRRKPQPQAFYMTSGSFFPNHHGTRLLQFSGSQPYTTPTASIVPTWSRDAKHHQELYCTDQQCAIPNSLACIYKGVDKQFPFFLVNDPERRFPFFLVNDPERSNRVAPEVSISQRLGNDCGPAQRGRDHQKFFSADSNSMLVLPRNGGAVSSFWFIKSEASTFFAMRVFQLLHDDLLEKEATKVLPFSWK
ncbi:hypothetical protein ACSBR2_010755 [Camellia fascicularis]